MSCIPCQRDENVRAQIEALAEILKTELHHLPSALALGLSETDIYDAGLFRGAIERVRGQFSASMYEKRDFAKLVLNFMQDQGAISSWNSAGGQNRFDYEVWMPNGRIAVVELKGCLDGNNTNIFERPPHAQEFYIWSVCQNAGADPRHNAWSGIHVRLGAEIIDKEKQVDGLIIWDMVCGTIGRPCPKLAAEPGRATEIGQHNLPPPCLYLFPRTVPSPRNNPEPEPHALGDLSFMSAIYETFGCRPEELFSVSYRAEFAAGGLVRQTTVSRDGAIEMQSGATVIRRR